MGDSCPQELGVDAPDSPDNAPALGVGTHTGCYGIGDARDTFTLKAPEHAGPVLYRLKISGPEAIACLVAKDADRAKIPRLDTCAKNPGAALDAWVVVMGGTSWSLETRDLSGNALKTAHPYTLDIQATPLADVGEPDAADKPVALTLGEGKQSFLVNAANADKLDNDYFSVDVPKDMKKKTRFQVAITDLADEAHVALEVLDANKKVVFSRGAPNPGANLKVDVKMKGPGMYVFHLRDISGTNKVIGGPGEPSQRATKPYTITVGAE
jgi:hypothetical protein